MTATGLIGGRYRLGAMLAEGGMGEVWRARDEVLGRDVAVKLLRGALASDTVVAERFRREARAAASLSHPHMANVFDYIEENGRPGIVMELVHGRTLAEIIAAEAPMPPARAADIMDQVLSALEVAHTAGIVHRDVKPSNVMLDDAGQAKVTDFGIARASGESTLTETGTVMGSVHYVAPEQLLGNSPDPSSDVYAAGVMLYEMLGGKRPFEAETPVAVAMSRLHNDPEPLRAVRPAIAPQLEHVVMRALARDPAHRFESAGAMRASLAAASAAAAARVATAPMPAAETASLVAQGDTTRIVPRSPAPRRTPRARREPKTPAPKRKHVRAALVGVLLGVATLIVASLVIDGPPERVRTPDLIGHRLEEAQKIAASLGLRTRVVAERVSNSDRNVVLEQQTEANALIEEGSVVGLIVSQGPPPCCTVPAVVGKKQSEAEDMLKAAGLARGAIGFRVSEEEPGTVLAQTPDAGASLSRGGEVDIVVATEPERRGKGKGNDD